MNDLTNPAHLALLQQGGHAVLLFFTYGVLGWMLEVAFAAVKEHKLVNRGFLCGPICPIYGFGMLALVAVVNLLPSGGAQPGWLAVFVVGALVATLVELVGGWALFKLYHTRWWDYSNMKFNLGGYICPQFTFLWGVGSVIMMKLIHPAMTHLENPLPLGVLLVLDAVLLVLFGVDVGLSAAAAVGLDKRLKEIDVLRDKLRLSSDKLTQLIGTNAMNADVLLDEQKLQLALASMEGRENAAALREELQGRATALRAKLDELAADKVGAGRLVRAFPDMKSGSHSESLASARQYWGNLAGKAKQTAATAAGAAKTAAKTAAETAAEKLKK